MPQLSREANTSNRKDPVTLLTDFLFLILVLSAYLDIILPLGSAIHLQEHHYIFLFVCLLRLIYVSSTYCKVLTMTSL